MQRLLLDLSINVTAMFRDPTFYLAFREKVVPLLRTYPFIRIWHAGCSTGEEVYSIAILLEEEGLYDRTRIYATDINEAVLDAGAARRLPAREDAGVHAQLHRRRAASASFSDYYVAAYDGAAFDRSLMRNVVFAQHNLALGPLVQRVPRHPLPQRDDLFRRALQERCSSCSTRASRGSASSALGHKESLREQPARGDATRRSTRRSACIARCAEDRGIRADRDRRVVGRPARGRAPCSTGSATQRAPPSSSPSTAARSGGELLAPLLQRHTPLVVREAEDKDSSSPGTSTSRRRLPHARRGRRDDRAVDRRRSSSTRGRRSTCCSVGRRGLPRTVRRVVLTGANEDGAEGLARIEELGGVAVVQDPRTAERREMPAAALAATEADVVLPLEEIGLFLRGLCSARAGSRGREPEVGLEPTTYGLQNVALPAELLRRCAQRSAATAGLRATAGACSTLRLTRWSALSIVFVSQPSSSAISS